MLCAEWAAVRVDMCYVLSRLLCAGMFEASVAQLHHMEQAQRNARFQTRSDALTMERKVRPRLTTGGIHEGRVQA